MDSFIRLREKDRKEGSSYLKGKVTACSKMDIDQSIKKTYLVNLTLTPGTPGCPGLPIGPVGP